jgi:hypothetical protein
MTPRRKPRQTYTILLSRDDMQLVVNPVGKARDAARTDEELETYARILVELFIASTMDPR